MGSSRNQLELNSLFFLVVFPRESKLTFHYLSWLLVLARHGPKSDPMTTVFHNAHGQAANISQQLAANGSESLDLSHVRWGRIDYLNATELMTRWIIFK